MVIDSSEWDDYRKTLASHGLDEGDFEPRVEEEQMPSAGIQPIRGTVIIKCRSTNVERRYECGHAKAWVADFNEDLAAGRFKLP